MGQHVPPGLAHHIRNLAGLCRAVSQSDADLLTAFVEFGDGESFAALVVRHGQAVWATCRQVLDNDADAEDAFQATFIALARKAGSLRREPLAGWLRKVAHEVALNAYKAARRRTAAHQRLCEYVTPPTAETPSADELSATVREELASLPERLRVPLALFYLDGKPQVEIAELLGVTDRSIRNRLARGLAALRERLANRGVVVTTAVLVAVLGNVPALSALPTSLVALTTASALAVADGKEITTPAAKLAEQVTAAAWSSRFKVLVFLTLVLGIGAGAVALPSSPDARPETPPPVPTPSTKAEERKADLFGDPLPPGAQVRIGTVRFRPGLSIGSATVAIAPDNKTLYSVHGRDEVRVWELTAGKGLQTIPAPKGCRGVAISPDGRRLIATGTGEAWAWDISAGVPQLLWKQKKRGLGDECVAFAPNGLFVACGGDTSNTIHLLDAVTGEERSTLPGRGTKLVFSPNGRTLASSADDEVVRLWDIGTGKERRALTCGTEKYARVNGFVFSPDGRTLVTVTKAGVMSAWDVTSGKECRLADVHSNAFVAFEPDGKTLIEAGAGQIRFRDPATGKESRKAVAAPSLTANVAIGDSCRLSADGKLFVSASVAAIGVWDVRTGKPVGPTDVPAGPVMSVSFSPDGQSVALVAMSANGGWNGSLPPQVYDARTGRLLKEFRFPQSDRPSLRLFRSPVR